MHMGVIGFWCVAVCLLLTGLNYILVDMSQFSCLFVFLSFYHLSAKILLNRLEK